MARRQKATEVEAIQIGKSKLKTLLSTARSTYREQHRVGGELGQAIANAVENDHLHRKAFSFIRAADRMEPEELADYLDHIELYLDMSGLKERAESAPRLQIEGNGAGETEEATAH